MTLQALPLRIGAERTRTAVQHLTHVLYRTCLSERGCVDASAKSSALNGGCRGESLFAVLSTVPRSERHA